VNELPLFNELETKIRYLLEELRRLRSQASLNRHERVAEEKLQRIEGKVRRIVELIDQLPGHN
jgi:hypothetical protein